jgi:hypothetical protein
VPFAHAKGTFSRKRRRGRVILAKPAALSKNVRTRAPPVARHPCAAIYVPCVPHLPRRRRRFPPATSGTDPETALKWAGMGGVYRNFFRVSSDWH